MEIHEKKRERTFICQNIRHIQTATIKYKVTFITLINLAASIGVAGRFLQPSELVDGHHAEHCKKV